MFCAQCGDQTLRDPCGACGRPTLLKGLYRLESQLGRGAMGTTWKGVEVTTGTVLAIKEVSLQRVTSDKARELLEREAAILQQLSHPMIPAGVESFTAGTGKERGLFIVQEFVDGKDLAGEMERRRYTQEEVLDIAEELLSVLGYLHDLSPPVIHRDLKPSNIMRRKSGELVLIDFGSVRDVLKDRDLGGSTVAGTFGYMAPEQLMGDASARSDLYALGATLVALLSRQDPQRMMGVAGLEWRPHVAVHPAMEQLLAGLLAPQADQRLASARVALAAVQQARADLQRPASALLAPPRSGGKSGGRALLLVALLGMLVVPVVMGASGVAYFILASSDTEPAVVMEPVVQPTRVEPIPDLVPDPVPEPTVDPDVRQDVGVGTYPPLGPIGAPVQVVVFSDFQCPYCARLAPVFHELRAQYPDEVVVYFRDYPLSFHKNARGAHELARCAAEQGQFWPAHDLLFDNYQDLNAEALDRYALRLELDTTALSRCQERDLSIIDVDMAAGAEVGVQGTPNTFVNGLPVKGAQAVESFTTVIDAELERLGRR
ncbi:MAG: protein-disulfide isomerase/predicted Ser/Thr protein kinase [Myxococcota bacterium]|jgi:protein-disulfide isomerase/predicted Ser/Thr protein kinase